MTKNSIGKSYATVMPSGIMVQPKRCPIPVCQSVKKESLASTFTCTLFVIASCELLLMNRASDLEGLILLGGNSLPLPPGCLTLFFALQWHSQLGENYSTLPLLTAEVQKFMAPMPPTRPRRPRSKCHLSHVARFSQPPKCQKRELKIAMDFDRHHKFSISILIQLNSTQFQNTNTKYLI